MHALEMVVIPIWRLQDSVQRAAAFNRDAARRAAAAQLLRPRPERPETPVASSPAQSSTVPPTPPIAASPLMPPEASPPPPVPAAAAFPADGGGQPVPEQDPAQQQQRPAAQHGEGAPGASHSEGSEALPVSAPAAEVSPRTEEGAPANQDDTAAAELAMAPEQAEKGAEQSLGRPAGEGEAVAGAMPSGAEVERSSTDRPPPKAGSGAAGGEAHVRAEEDAAAADVPTTPVSPSRPQLVWGIAQEDPPLPALMRQVGRQKKLATCTSLPASSRAQHPGSGDVLCWQFLIGAPCAD